MLPQIQYPTIDYGLFQFGESATKISSFKKFVHRIHPARRWPDYAYQLFNVLQRVADGEIDRVMVFMPPRHFKSEIVSRLFSAYYLLKYPDQWVSLCSYAAELAYTLSRNARDNYTKAGGQLADTAAAVKHWETGKGGGLWAAGVGGAATGKGFHLGIIDDPIKNSEEAQSLVIQNRNNDWYDSTFSTRQEPGAAIVVIQTRWSIHDTAGYLLDKEKEEPENWHILNFEAIKSEQSKSFPVTCTLESDKRQPGQALNPKRYPADKLNKIANRIGTYFFSALYQQNPTLRQGRVYYEFNTSGPDVSQLDLRQADGYWHSHDFGAVNSVWGLWAKMHGRYYLIFEQQLPEATTKTRATIVKSRLDRLDVIAGYGGADSETQQRKDYAEAGLSILLPFITDVESQIDSANEMLRTGQMVICANCVHTIHQMENCIRDAKGEIAEKSKWHYLDMVRYFAAGIKLNTFTVDQNPLSNYRG